MNPFPQVANRHRALIAACFILTAVGAVTVTTVVRSGNTTTPVIPNRPFHRHKHRHRPPPAPADFDPPEVTIGERLFLETRFAQFFAASGVGVNQDLPSGDPILIFTQTTGAPLLGPFAGRSMNCRACHLVDEQVDVVDGGMRTYGDFTFRSPISDRGDGKTTTPRNSPPLVNASIPRDGGLILHFDGEFVTLPDLVKSAYTGRNFGWLPRESNAAIANLARVIREDNGQGDLAQEFGGFSYRVVLTGKDPSIPAEFKLPKAFRLDVAHATDSQILDAVANLVSVYTEQLEFSKDDDGNFNLSPFDVFLERNNLPRQPESRETNLEFSRRLLRRIRQLDAKHALKFVDGNPNTTDGAFEFHPNQEFKFSPTELRGLFIFFGEPPSTPLSQTQVNAGGLGNCVACHAAPTFTDFGMHNTGATQAEYDAIHGPNAFANLTIPGLVQRLANHDLYLPATSQHPDANGRFRSVPRTGDPSLTDLGLWNIFANPDFPKPQLRLWQILCDQEIGQATPLVPAILHGRCAAGSLLPKSIALFKTAGLRDLSHGAPYLHNGQFATLEEVIALYRNSAALQRSGHLRNGDRDLAGIALRPQDVAPLVEFLRSLNEDYQ